MKKYKRLKDPIYGYISIEDNVIYKLVDTPAFQRLRNIIQTSYSPLYSSAVHNRFVHSLGVYHLGCIVADTLKDHANDCGYATYNLDRMLELFTYACLLHDVGHAPYSHTGEANYLTNGDRDSLHTRIIDLTGDDDLKNEIEGKNYKAAPHELMSVIVSLNDFSFLFNSDEERSFFARCITGYSYVKDDEMHSFYNCLISLLNSTVIDVDKLDYLIRDAYITGFDTVNIDYERLLTCIRIRKDVSSEKFEVVFNKGAISVIENVVYAHDAERKWIQNHPSVLYEIYLLTSSIELLKETYNQDLFSYNALSDVGVDISENFKVTYLCDADVLFLMKNLPKDTLTVVKEFFSRKDRRHPLWKSESEYMTVFKPGCSEKTLEIIDKELESLCKYLNFINNSSVVDEKAHNACIADIEATEKLLEADTQNANKYRLTISEKRKHRKWIEIFSTYATNQGIPFDFLILRTNQFNSGFAKEEFAKIRIDFPGLYCPPFESVTNVLRAEKSSRDKYFYIFYRRKKEDPQEGNNSINVKELAILLGREAIVEAYN